MAKQNDVGVFQLDNGKWAFRYTFTKNGKRSSRRSCKDEFGNPLNTKRAAIKARKSAIEAETLNQPLKPIIHKTVAEVFKEYREKGCSGKAYQTIKKQDSLWKNHIRDKFGKKYVDSITVAEVNDYLTQLYYVDGYAYKYTESFLKMFYLIFGQAYSRNYLSIDTYSKLCINKDTKIKMPNLKTDEDTEIVTFNREEIALLDEYFKGTNAETAYLLGKYCGLRISECYGLKWDNVNFRDNSISIDRQMQYQNGLIKLVSLKTRNAKRTVYMNKELKNHLKKKWQQAKLDAITFAAVREQKQRFIDDLDDSKISSTELVNCLPNGTIQTVNSFKYPSREIKSKLGIQFKYHYLRHTFGTRMAEMNTPQHLLCSIMGHGNIHVTQQYYIAVSKRGIEILQNNLNQL
ncbi:tyrosine-type recombinase/integrase [Blautia obeum]|uniref:tyrosine-type recombinase/integrase n=1 Tax=Blautia obeum TaxID=40520 RepID=UPI0032BFCC15